MRETEVSFILYIWRIALFKICSNLIVRIWGLKIVGRSSDMKKYCELKGRFSYCESVFATFGTSTCQFRFFVIVIPTNENLRRRKNICSAFCKLIITHTLAHTRESNQFIFFTLFLPTSPQDKTLDSSSIIPPIKGKVFTPGWWLVC